MEAVFTRRRLTWGAIAVGYILGLGYAADLILQAQPPGDADLAPVEGTTVRFTEYIGAGSSGAFDTCIDTDGDRFYHDTDCSQTKDVGENYIDELTEPGGLDGDVQFNDSGSFGGFGDWDGTTLDIEGAFEAYSVSLYDISATATITATFTDDTTEGWVQSWDRVNDAADNYTGSTGVHTWTHGNNVFMDYNLTNPNTLTTTQPLAMMALFNGIGGTHTGETSCAAVSGDCFGARTAGDTADRLVMEADGQLQFGSGSAAPDACLERTGVGVIEPCAGDTLGGICSERAYDFFVDQNQKNLELAFHGFIKQQENGHSFDSGSPLTDKNGISKTIMCVISGFDTDGSVTATGTSVDRDTGGETASDTSVVTIDGTSSDSTTTDANGETVYDLEDCYIFGKWFKGDVTYTTTDTTMTIDTYSVAFDQNNDTANSEIKTMDFTGKPTNGNAWLSLHLYHLDVTGDKVTIATVADGVLENSDIDANELYRVRRGGIDTAFDGTSDGWWLQIGYGRASNTDWNAGTGTVTIESCN